MIKTRYPTSDQFVRYVIDNTGDHGTQIVLSLMKENDPLWKSFVENGWIERLSKSDDIFNSLGADLPDKVALTKNKEAVLLVGPLLRNLKSAELLFEAVALNGMSLAAKWSIDAVQDRIDSSTIGILLGALVESGFDLCKSNSVSYDDFNNAGYKETFKMSPAGEVIFNYSSGKFGFNDCTKALKGLFDLGAKFNKEVCAAIILTKDFGSIKSWLDWSIEEMKLAKLDDFAEAAFGIASEDRYFQDHYAHKRLLCGHGLFNVLAERESRFRELMSSYRAKKAIQSILSLSYQKCRYEQ